METVNPICAGMDVHKDSVTVCLITRSGQGNSAKSQRVQEIRTFKTTTPALLSLHDWLKYCGCRTVAMESTSVYWKPIFNLLEGDMEVTLVNPAHIKQVPGRKTDVGDAQWIAELLEHGLLKGSFIPPVDIRDLRDLTRYRFRMVEERAAEVNRVQKLLETANIRLGSVATNVMGVSGRQILAALLAGEKDPEKLSELAKGRMRSKRAELQEAMQGVLRPHHLHLLSHMLEHIDFLSESIAECEVEIDEMCRPFAQEVERLTTIPGVDKTAAQAILAEVGVDMEVFPSHKHLCSWAGVSPGNNESGGKRRSGKTTKGNKWLRALLTQCAHCAGRTKDTFLGAQYRRFKSKKGTKRAAIVVAHRILEEVWFILKDDVRHIELGANYLQEINKERIIKHHVHHLERLGVKVKLEKAA